MDPVVIRSTLQAPSVTAGRRAEEGGGKSSFEEVKLRKACADFESLLLYSLLKTMRQTVPQNAASSVPGKGTYDMIMDQKLAQEISGKGRGVGLQEMLYEQLKGQLKEKQEIR